MQVVRGTDFERVRFGDLSTLPIRYIREDIAERKAIKLNDVLIETAGGTKDQPTGRTVHITERVIRNAKLPLICASFARFLRPDFAVVDPAFLFWKLQAEYHSGALRPFHIQHTGVARFQYTQFATNHPFQFPDDLDEQRTTAEVLSELDEKIELNRRMNETLEGMAQAIFRDWFVDFGPTRRKVAGEADPVAIMGGLTPDPARAAQLATLFPAAFGDDGLPVGWTEAEFGAEFDLTMGQSPPGDTYNDTGDGLPFFQGRTDFGFRYPENRKYCSAPSRIANAGDTLISVRAPVGDLNMAWERCCIGRGVACARHKSGSTSYTFYTLRSLQPELELYEHTGTVFGAINRKQFEKLPVVKSGNALVEAFEAIAGPMDEKLKLATQESRTLAETRDYLLPRLMSGAVRVAPKVEAA
ncbi:restriction endonuclease subunit S [Novosphingobium huizhouense]|uniref:restriction endonuclease subunit S n=1 Tax=Novosphingobium huizhouense TaxID=2866625 RepID=UPI001CD86618|nr:restriction endonuclease subunit S [Novosphingobium huizhouense]